MGIFDQSLARGRRTFCTVAFIYFYSLFIGFVVIVATYYKCWCFYYAGEVVGALSFSVGHGSGVLKKVASVRMVHQTNDLHNIVPYTLKKRVSIVGKLSSLVALAKNDDVAHKPFCIKF